MIGSLLEDVSQREFDSLMGYVWKVNSIINELEIVSGYELDATLDDLFDANDRLNNLLRSSR